MRSQTLAPAEAGEWLELMSNAPAPENRIRLVISDVDGTLLDNSKELTSGAPEAVERLYQAGIRFTIASACRREIPARPLL